MKKALITTLFAMAILAQSQQQLSPIPLPRNTVIDLDPEPYDAYMIKDALERGQVFTFLAKSSHTDDPDLMAQREELLSLFRIGAGRYHGGLYRVAFLLPARKIGKYAASTTKSALAYLAQRGQPFTMDVVTVPDENEETLQAAVAGLSGYSLVIAPVTRKGAAVLCTQSLPGRFFVPTLNRDSLECDNDMVSFGGIDYDRQIETLGYFVDENATTYVVTDNSPLSRSLTSLVEKYVHVDGTIAIGKNGYYRDVIERYDDLNQSTMFLNVPVVKSSLFLSQMTLADFKPQLLLSTQLNYSPLLLTLTQYHDRENLLVASSIGDADPVLTENIALVGQDLRFNWINYATIVGLDSDFATVTQTTRLTREMFADNTLQYRIRVYDAGLYRFVPREIPEPQEEIVPPYDEESIPESEPSVFSQEESSE